MKPIDLSSLVQGVAQSRRYRHLASSLIERLAREEIPKSKNQADAEKRTKRRLHQIFGAYATPLDYEHVLAELRDADDFSAACRKAMRLHASSAERLGEVESLYQRVFEITGPPRRLLDLACGFNPLAIVEMKLSHDVEYLASDIDSKSVDFLNRFFNLPRFPANVHARAEVNDLIAGPPGFEADVALLLKTLPCLVHQTLEPLGVLKAIRARWLVVSFPTRSLGQRSKGMRENYHRMFLEMVAGEQWAIDEIELQTELAFVVRKQGE